MNSYRIEYAVDDGPWIELSETPDGDAASTVVPLPWLGVTYTFRMRALNDAGAGGHSNVVKVVPPKRRPPK